MLKNKKTILGIAIVLALVGAFIWIFIISIRKRRKIRRNRRGI